MIGREAFDSAEEQLSEMTGMQLSEATALLEEHDGDPNAAAEAYFNQINTPSSETMTDGSTTTTSTNSINLSSVDLLFENTAAMTDSDRPTATVVGRRLNETTANNNHSDSNEPLHKRTVHVAFFQNTIIFFEKVPDKASKKARRGVHTYDSTAGPYANRPDISSWVGDMLEIQRVSVGDANYKKVMADMNNNRVPSVIDQNDTGSRRREQFSLVLHDLRTKAPPPVVTTSISSSKNFQGAGHSLGGSRGSNGSRTPERSTISTSSSTTAAASSSKSSNNNNKESNVNMLDVAFVLLGAVMCPLLCSFLFGWNVHLGHSVIGGFLSFYAVKAWRTLSQVTLEYTVVDPLKPTTKIKFQLCGTRTTWTQTFNHSHTLQMLHMSVAEQLFGKSSTEYRDFFTDLTTAEEGTEAEDLALTLHAGFGRQKRMLNAFDTITTIKDAKLIQERLEVTVKKGAL